LNRRRSAIRRLAVKMIRRSKATGVRALRELASLPLYALGKGQRRQILERLSASMVSKVDLPDGKSLYFMTSTALLQARALSVLSKEPDTIQWIDRFKTDEVFWDVGANVGVFGLYAARRRGIRVVAFEPSADNYMVLCRNVEMNKLDEHITPYCIALAGKTELGMLNIASMSMGAAWNQFGRRGETSRYWSSPNNVYVQGMVGYAIDDFISYFQPPFPTHLKIDVDGLEWQILQGGRQTLCDPRLKSIMVELCISDPVDRDQAIAHLAEVGFELFLQGEIQESGGQAAANHFFVRSQASMI
jgi:FkbM family methyltransferase